MNKLIHSDTRKPLQETDIDPGIRDIVKKLNKITRTHYSCQGHIIYSPRSQSKLFGILMERIGEQFEISTKYLQLVDGSKVVEIEQPYISFDHNDCVESVFKEAGFKVTNSGTKRNAELIRRKQTIVLTDNVSGFIRYEQEKFDEAWNKFKKEIKRCEK